MFSTKCSLIFRSTICYNFHFRLNHNYNAHITDGLRVCSIISHDWDYCNMPRQYKKYRIVDCHYIENYLNLHYSVSVELVTSCNPECSEHGLCSSGNCYCENGWKGTDCSEGYNFIKHVFQY